MSRPEIKKVREQFVDLRERCDADAQTNALLEASVVLALDETKAQLTRLGSLERRCQKRQHEQAELKTQLVALIDYLDRIDPSPAGGKA